MHELNIVGYPVGAVSYLKDLGKMVGLPGIGNINDALGFFIDGALTDSGKIGGGIVKAAVRLSHNQRLGVPVFVGKPFQENNLGPLIFF